VTIEATPTPALKRTYPHLSQVTDPMAQQTIRLLWDRIWDLEARLQASEATIADLVSGHNTNNAQITVAQRGAEAALSLAQRAGVAATSETGPWVGAGELPGGGDGSGGQIGCAAAGATGHDTGGLLNAIRAGQIVCGTGNEFSWLKNPTATLAERLTNGEELLLRMIWHLKQAGFSAGRQLNPSGVLSGDKLCVVVDGVTRVYDVFLSYETFGSPLQTQMLEYPNPNLQDHAGIPD